jgi:hypothetical protein
MFPGVVSRRRRSSVQQRPLSGVFSDGTSDGVGGGGSGSVAGWTSKGGIDGLEVGAVVEEPEDSPERMDANGEVEE